MFCYNTGSLLYHEWGTVAASHMKGGTWAVEYARGFIPSTLATGLADTLFCTLDFITLFNMARVYTKTLLMEAGYYITHVQEVFA